MAIITFLVASILVYVLTFIKDFNSEKIMVAVPFIIICWAVLMIFFNL